MRSLFLVRSPWLIAALALLIADVLPAPASAAHASAQGRRRGKKRSKSRDSEEEKPAEQAASAPAPAAAAVAEKPAPAPAAPAPAPAPVAVEKPAPAPATAPVPTPAPVAAEKPAPAPADDLPPMDEPPAPPPPPATMPTVPVVLPDPSVATVVINQDNRIGTNWKLVRVEYFLNDKLIANMREGDPNLAKGTTLHLWEGVLPKGTSKVQARAIYKGTNYQVFSYMNDEEFPVTSTAKVEGGNADPMLLTFVVTENKDPTVNPSKKLEMRADLGPWSDDFCEQEGK